MTDKYDLEKVETYDSHQSDKRVYRQTDSAASQPEQGESCKGRGWNHDLVLRYMTDAPDNTPVAMQGTCRNCGQQWVFDNADLANAAASDATNDDKGTSGPEWFVETAINAASQLGQGEWRVIEGKTRLGVSYVTVYNLNDARERFDMTAVRGRTFDEVRADADHIVALHNASLGPRCSVCSYTGDKDHNCIPPEASQPEPPTGGPWRFLDARSKAIVKDGVKLEFASHSDAVIGREVLNALEQQLAEQAKTFLEMQATSEKAHNDELTEAQRRLRWHNELRQATVRRAEQAEAERDRYKELLDDATKAIAGFHEVDDRLAAARAALREKQGIIHYLDSAYHKGSQGTCEACRAALADG